MKLQRVIHHLEDGRRKYVTHNGEMEKWSEAEIDNLRRNMERYGPAAYTADFAKYGISSKELRERYPDAKIIRIVGFETEDHDLPLDPNIIF
jgi:hypothetical protein